MGNLTDCRHSVRFISIMYIALCLLLVVGALAQVPTTCPGPKSFEGRFSRFDRERKFLVKDAIAYDESMRRIAELEDFDIAGNHTYYHKLKLYNENKEYTVNLKTRNCTVGPPHPNFHPWGVMPGSKFEAEAVIGAAGVPGESVNVATFTNKEGNDTFMISVTEPSCFPVSYKEFTTQRGLEVRDFYDCKEGIADPTVFFVPKECAGL